ncbi:MAG: ROK family protein [Bifidobacteriaceae bacterium]|nr:ROK family protein [Bifidobacteriaceae bacterium]MCI1914726.1 ROK family protein [Bifidobacteriaceae bacterium]
MTQSHFYVVAVDIGGTKVAGCLVDFGPDESRRPEPGSIVRQPADAQQGSNAVLRRVFAVISEVLRQAGSEQSQNIAGVGVSAAGVVGEDGSIVSATDLIRDWAGTKLRERIMERFGLPAVVIGDVHAHALGESHWGAGRVSNVTLLAAVGTGIGGAVCVGGRLLRGSHGMGGHIGHVSVAAAGTAECSCGRRGHVEPIASGSGIIAEYEQVCAASGRSYAPDVDGRDISRKAVEGEKEAGLVIRTAGMSLGIVLGSLANVVDPDLVILSGSVTAAGDLWWKSLRDGYMQSAMDIAASVPLVRGELGDDAPLIGAAEAFVDTVGARGEKRSVWVEQKR